MSDELSRDAQRYLDGEPHGPLTEAERARADQLRRMGAAARATVRGVDAALTDRVMAAVRQEAPPQRSAVAWAMGPTGMRVRRWWIPVAAAALLAIWVAGARFGSSRGVEPGPLVRGGVPGSPRADTVYVRFELTAPGARQVRLAGDFSGWQPEVQLVRGEAGLWVATVPIAVGVHRYQFVVDEDWVPDPAAGAIDDGFGGRNSVVVVGPKGVVRS